MPENVDEQLKALFGEIDDACEAKGIGPKDKMYLCPVCYEPFKTRDEKTDHMEKVEGYQILRTSPIDA